MIEKYKIIGKNCKIFVSKSQNLKFLDYGFSLKKNITE
jgi:hypothetical protein